MKSFLTRDRDKKLRDGCITWKQGLLCDKCRGKVFFVKDPNLLHRVNILCNVCKSGACANRENIIDDVLLMK